MAETVTKCHELLQHMERQRVLMDQLSALIEKEIGYKEMSRYGWVDNLSQAEQCLYRLESNLKDYIEENQK